MSEGHFNDVPCSASTSSNSNCLSTSNKEKKTAVNRLPKICVNELPWKLVPEVFEDGSIEYEYLDYKHGGLSDAESFVWKWSPCGRYGIDLPGGRDFINQQLKDRVAVFDLHHNRWTFYVIDEFHFDIPRVCFLYWARNDIIATVSLLKDSNHGPDDEINIKFRHSFYYVSHETQALVHTSSCKYRTNKTIVASYWYHIFENRCGEPFVDHNNDLWVVFSNGKDSLILLPYVPTPTIAEAKCVNFDMNDIVSDLIGTRVYLDPFVSSHFVPFVYRNEINFFLRVSSLSFVEEEHRDYGQEEEIEDVTTKKHRGVFQMRINLRDVIERGEKAVGPVDKSLSIETRFGRKDVELWRKIAEDNRLEHVCFTQHGKTVALQKWSQLSIDMSLSKNLSTRVADIAIRSMCCSNETRDFSYCSIDLDTTQIKKFDAVILGTDVIVPHPSGSLFMFRYKEYYGMTYCELPFFPPLSLFLKCTQVSNNGLKIDNYSPKCCLKTTEEDLEYVVDEFDSLAVNK